MKKGVIIFMGIIGIGMLALGIYGFILSNNTYNKEDKSRQDKVLEYASFITGMYNDSVSSGITIDDTWFKNNEIYFVKNGVSCEEMSYDATYGVVLKKCDVVGEGDYYYVSDKIYTSESKINKVLVKEEVEEPKKEETKLTGEKVLSCLATYNEDPNKAELIETYYNKSGMPYKATKALIITYATNEEAVSASTSEEIIRKKELDDFDEIKVEDNELHLLITRQYTEEILLESPDEVKDINLAKGYYEDGMIDYDTTGTCTIKEI